MNNNLTFIYQVLSLCSVFQVLIAYLDYMTRVGELLGGGDDVRELMTEVLEFEVRLANVSTIIILGWISKSSNQYTSCTNIFQTDLSSTVCR